MEKQVAAEKLRQIVREQQAERAGVVVPKPLREGAQRGMSDHLAEFLSDLRSTGRDAKSVYNVD